MSRRERGGVVGTDGNRSTADAAAAAADGARPGRRALLGAAGVPLLLTGCGGGSGSTTQDEADGPADLVATAQVPVGGAVAVDGPRFPIVVAQPSEGEFVAYNAKCPHQGCTVAPQGDVYDCPCHGSRFALDTGEVLRGPAELGLVPVEVQVVDGTVRTTA